MLLDIFLTVPLLLMTNVAWYIRVGFVQICLIALFAIAIGAVSFYRGREDDPFLSHQPRPKLVPEA